MEGGEREVAESGTARSSQCLCTGICTGQHKGASVSDRRTHTLLLWLLTHQLWLPLFLSCVSPPLLLTSFANSHSGPVAPWCFPLPHASHLGSTFPPLLYLLPVAAPLAELFMAAHCAKWPVHCGYRRIHFIRAFCVVVCVCVCVKWLVGIGGWTEVN